MVTQKPTRFTALSGVFVGLSVLWLHDTAQIYAETQELKEFVVQRVEEAIVVPHGYRFLEIAVDAHVARPLLVFGQPNGRATIYTRATRNDNQVVYWAINYHCERRADGWRLCNSFWYVDEGDLAERSRSVLASDRCLFIKASKFNYSA